MQEKEKNKGRNNGKENIKKKEERKEDRTYVKDTTAAESRGRPCREKGKRQGQDSNLGLS